MAVYSSFAENGNGAAGEEKRDAFVGGLSPDTTEADLNQYFAQFGPVLHSVVKRDLNTGLSRGFGFVTFADSTGLGKIGSVPIHILKGKKIDAKAAVRKLGKDVVLKIFVGGVDTSMSEEDIKSYFERFGKVSAVQWPKDRLRDGAKKNFVFVEFEDPSVVETIIKSPKHSIGSRLCDVRKAVPAVPKPPGAYGADPYAGAYPAYPGYGAQPAYDPAAYAGYAAGYYDHGAAAAAAYDQSGYAGYGDASYGADPAHAAAAVYADPYASAAPAAASAYADPYASAAPPTAAAPYGTIGYPGSGAESAAYPPPVRGAYRPRGAPMPLRGAPRPPYGAVPPVARGGIRGFHPYRRV